MHKNLQGEHPLQMVVVVMLDCIGNALKQMAPGFCGLVELHLHLREIVERTGNSKGQIGFTPDREAALHERRATLIIKNHHGTSCIVTGASQCVHVPYTLGQQHGFLTPGNSLSAISLLHPNETQRSVGLRQFWTFEQLELSIVASALATSQLGLRHAVAAGTVLADGETYSLSKQYEHHISVPSKHRPDYRWLEHHRGVGGLVAAVVEKHGREWPAASRAPEQSAQAQRAAPDNDRIGGGEWLGRGG